MAWNREKAQTHVSINQGSQFYSATCLAFTPPFRGVACVEAGLIDDAIEQFQIAYEKKQNVFEAAHLLGLCFKEKSMWEEAHQAFAKALRVDGISQQNILAVKYELGLILKEQGKTKEALELLEEIFISGSKI